MARKIVKVVFNETRGVLVFRHLINAWQKRDLGLSGIIPWERQILDAASDMSPVHKAWLLYIFAALNLSRQKTRTVAKKMLAILYNESFRRLINPYEMANKIFQETSDLYRSRPLLKKFWQESIERFKDTDPRQIFIEHGSNKESLISELDGIPSIGLKVAHLMVAYFEELALSRDKEFLEKWPQARSMVVMPIDVHWFKFLRQCQIIKRFNSEYHNSVIQQTIDFSCNLCIKYELNHLDLMQGNFYTHSQICALKPEDPDRRKIYCFNNCPLESFCTMIVQPTDQENKSGIVGWSSAKPRERLEND